VKRDIDLLRTILLNAEADMYPYGALVTVDGFSKEICAYHVALLIDVGLVEGHIVKTDGAHYVSAMINRITSTGYDFIDGIREDTLWGKAKEYVIKPWLLSS